MMTKAVFLDRDGTLMEDPGYLSDAAGVKLLPGVDLAIKSLRQGRFKIVVVTNQSGIARGMLTEETLEKIHAELRRQLAEKGAMLDAIYYCPFHPEGLVPKYTKDSDLRKPGPGMLHKAAEQLDIDLHASWMVGDSIRDVIAGRTAGCRTILIRTSEDQTHSPADTEKEEEFQADVTVRNLVEAARTIMRSDPRPDEQTESSDPQIPEETDETAEPPVAPDTDCTEEDVQQDADQRTETPTTEADSQVRKEILQHVRQISRQDEHEEFSITNLLGGVSQVLVGLFLLLVFYKVLGTGQIDQATLWAVVAAVFQAMSLTFFMMSRRR